METFKEGEFITISKGEYSDYCVKGLFKVLIEFDANKELINWCNDTGRVYKHYNDDHDPVYEVECDYNQKNITDSIKFLEYLNRKNIIVDVNYRELHTGSYGETQLMES